MPRSDEALADVGLTVRDLAHESYETAKAKGWHDEDDQRPSLAVVDIAYNALRIAAICKTIEQIRATGVAPALDPHPRGSTVGLDDRQVRVVAWLGLACTEAAEAIDDVIAGRWDAITRADGKPEGLPSELADIIVRVCDSAGALGIDIERALREKLAFNRTRSHKHGGKAA